MTKTKTLCCIAVVVTLLAAGCGGSSDATDEPPARVEGVYRTSVTRAELEAGPLYDAGELNDENWGEMTLRLRDGRVSFAQKNPNASSSTSGRYTVEGDRIVLEFDEGVNAGEIFTLRWKLYRDSLAFERVPDDDAPVYYILEPWRRAD